MGQILGVVLPVFGLIGVGAAVAWAKLLGPKTGDALSEFVFAVAIPLLVLRIMATADLGSVSAWRLWVAFFSAFVISWIAGTVLTRWLFGRDARGGLVAGLAAGYGNTTLIGLPLALAAFGAEGAVPIALIIAAQLPAMMTAIAFLMPWAERKDGAARDRSGPGSVLRSLIENLAGNPIVIGLAAGLAWRLSGIPFAGLPADIVDRLSNTAGALALFAMGMSLRHYGISGNVAAGLVLTFVKLIVMPGLALVTASLIGLPPIATKVVIITAACPTGVTAFLVAGRFRTGQGLASTTITLSTGLGVLSVAFWVALADWI